MTASGATKRRVILAYIRSYHGEHGFAPSLREIMAGTEISSTSIVNFHLAILAEQGVITRSPRVARGITLKKERP